LRRRRLVETGVKIRRVDLHEDVARLHELVVGHQDDGNAAGHLRCDFSNVAIDEGIIGGFEVARVQPVGHDDGGDDDQQHGPDHDEAPVPPTAAWAAPGRRRRRLHSRLGRLRHIGTTVGIESGSHGGRPLAPSRTSRVPQSRDDASRAA